MEIKAYFSDIRKIIIKELQSAQKEILIASAWFTNHDIFDVLIEKVSHLEVKLIVLNDDINNRIDGLDFQNFINKGGIFYYGFQENPMHNKYCIIDNKVLITGSYNYTYLAESINEENIIVIKGVCDIIDSYKDNFIDTLIANKKPIDSISKYLENNPYNRNVFSFNNYGQKDIYRHIYELKNEGQTETAVHILNQLNSDVVDSDSFIIRDVIYRQWKQDYYADKIQVIDDNIIITYRTVAESGCWIHGSKAKYAWLIRNSENHSEFVNHYKITNIKINGKIQFQVLEGEKIYYFSVNNDINYADESLGYKLNEKGNPINEKREEIPIEIVSVPKGFELSCEIHFKIKNLTNKTIDLIEGFDTDEKDNHWHCFEINMRLNREVL
jgi:hypothetical protein